MAIGDPTSTRRDSLLDQSMPYSQQAERAVLGAILLDNSAYNQAAALLLPEDFFEGSNRIIFLRMTEMAERSTAIDMITLCDELIRHKELDSIGGASYVSSLTDGLPRLNIEHYVKIVKDRSMLRYLIAAANTIVTKCWDGSEDAEDILDAAENAVLSLASDRVRTGFADFKNVFQKNFSSLDALHDRGKRVTGLETGFRQFDDMTRGLQPAEMIIVAARPSMGKTSFALDVARWVAIHEKQPVGLFSVEMSAGSLVLRLLCSEADVDSHKLQTGFASRDDWTKLAMALGRLAEAPIFIDDTPGLSVMEMRAKARRLKQEHGLGLLVIDYMQLMSGRAKEENRTQEVSAISRGLKGLAKELNIPVMAISQLSRAPETRGGKPRLSDLRESGQIEQDADVVAFLYREEMVNPNDENRGLAELIIAKQRNGPTGTVNLVFLPQFTSFRNPPEVFEEGDRE